jgi:hypothetical protein
MMTDTERINALRAELETVRADLAETRKAGVGALHELADIEKQITGAAIDALPPLVIKKRLYIDLEPAYDSRMSRLAKREAELSREISHLTLTLQGARSQEGPTPGMSKADKRAELHRRGVDDDTIERILKSNLP